MAERRRYTKRQKLAAVMATEMAGVVQAAAQTGIPATTIEYWLHKPEFADFRTKTRAELAEEVKVVAHLAWKRVAETMPTMEPRDALFAADKASTILALMSGEATSRTEHRDLTDTFDDHEWDSLVGLLREAAEGASAGD